MRNFFTLIIFCFITIGLAAQQNCTISDQGTSDSYNLKAGDVLCIESGVFTGSILEFDSKAQIKINENATFQPSFMSAANGSVFNKGVIKLDNHFTFGEHFSLQNDSNAVVFWNVEQTFLGAIYIENKKFSEMNFSAPLNILSGSSVVNEGVIKMISPLTIEQGALMSNEGVTYLNKKFVCGGTVYNSGVFKVANESLLETDSKFINKCTFYSKNTIVNKSNMTENYGYINVYGKEGNNQLINYGNLFNYETGIIQVNDFDNFGTLTGAGSFIVFQLSRNYGDVGNDGGGINFYDKTPTNNQIFDVQAEMPDNSVSKIATETYDTTYISNYCNLMVFPDFINMPLPVSLRIFEVSPVQCSVQLRWITDFEKNCSYYAIQRKGDHENDFSTIQTIQAYGNSTEEHSYEYKDEQVQNGTYQYRLKIVDFDGNNAYSKVNYTKVFCGDESTTTLYPNPVSDYLNISLNTNNDDTYYFIIYDLAGRMVYSQSQNFGNGLNTFMISTSQFQNGFYSIVISNNVKTETFKFVKNE